MCRDAALRGQAGHKKRATESDGACLERSQNVGPASNLPALAGQTQRRRTGKERVPGVGKNAQAIVILLHAVSGCVCVCVCVCVWGGKG
jgi:hypothetical protein